MYQSSARTRTSVDMDRFIDLRTNPNISINISFNFVNHSLSYDEQNLKSTDGHRQPNNCPCRAPVCSIQHQCFRCIISSMNSLVSIGPRKGITQNLELSSIQIYNNSSRIEREIHFRMILSRSKIISNILHKRYILFIVLEKYNEKTVGSFRVRQSYSDKTTNQTTILLKEEYFRLKFFQFSPYV